MDDSVFGTLNEKLIKASQSNGHVDFTEARKAFLQGKGEEPVLSADLFRDLYSGSPVSGQTGTSVVRRCGHWSVKAARFDHHVDLSDCTCSGGALPSLEFEDCLFPEGFCADHAVIRRLSFSGCSFGVFPDILGYQSSISLRNTRLEGDLRLAKLTSLRPDKLLSICAFGLQLNGSLRLSETELKVPADNRKLSSEPPHYALELNGATIRNEVKLFPSVIVRGGLRIRTARIGGDIIFANLDVSDDIDSKFRRGPGFWPRFSIDATSCDIGGNLFFTTFAGFSRFTSNGAVTFFGFECKGTVDLSGARFSWADGDRNALDFSSGSTKGNFIAAPIDWADQQTTFTCDGHMVLTGLSVGGLIDLTGVCTTFTANLAKVHGDVNLAIQVSPELNLGGADLKGSLDLSKISVPYAPDEEHSLSGFGSDQRIALKLNLKDVQIGHSLVLAEGPSSRKQLMKCYRRRMHCYVGYYLYELYEEGGGGPTILFKIGEKPILLNGTSVQINRLNRDGALRLKMDISIRDYVRFFGAYVWGEEGPFVVVEDSSEITVADPPAAVQKQLHAIGEIEIHKDFPDNRWKQLWGLIEPGIGAAEHELYKKNFKKNAVTATTHIRYGAKLFRVKFVIVTKPFSIKPDHDFETGWIRIIEDEEVASLKAAPEYKRPLTHIPDSDYRSDLKRVKLEIPELSILIPDWAALMKLRTSAYRNASIDLKNASCITLDDADGRAWEDVAKLELENFTYTRIVAPLKSDQITLTFAGKLLQWILGILETFWGILEDGVRELVRIRASNHPKLDRVRKAIFVPAEKLLIFFGKKGRQGLRFALSDKRLFGLKFWYGERPRAAVADRRKWLEHMPKSPFIPQPYAHLTNVLYAAGDREGAEAIEKEKINHEIKERSQDLLRRGVHNVPRILISRFMWFLFWLKFDYGLSPWRATFTFIFWLLVGWAAVTALNAHGYLVQNTSTAATMLTKNANGEFTAVFPHSTGPTDGDDLKCGNAINGLLYAADVFIPLLDLREEERCDIRSFHPGEINPGREWGAQKRFSSKCTHYLWALFHSSVPWLQFAKSLYAVLGWVVVSLTILTYSGVLRRWGEQ